MLEPSVSFNITSLKMTNRQNTLYYGLSSLHEFFVRVKLKDTHVWTRFVHDWKSGTIGKNFIVNVIIFLRYLSVCHLPFYCTIIHRLDCKVCRRVSSAEKRQHSNPPRIFTVKKFLRPLSRNFLVVCVNSAWNTEATIYSRSFQNTLYMKTR